MTAKDNITLPREVVELALEAFEAVMPFSTTQRELKIRAVEALRTRLAAQQPKPESFQVAKQLTLRAIEELTEENVRLRLENGRLREAIKAYIRAKNSDGGEVGGFFPKPPTVAHQRRVHLAWQELNAALRREDKR